MVTFKPHRITLWKEQLYPLNRRLGGLHSRSGRLWKRIKSLDLSRIRTPDHTILSVATKPITQLPQITRVK